MSLKHRRAREWIRKRQRKTKRDFPLATMVFYGPDDQTATKLAVAIIEDDETEPVALDRWLSNDDDIRHDDQVFVDVVECLKAHSVQRVLSVDRIFGCPHEEGIDYPEGEACPLCPFWAHRDRYSGESIDDKGTDDVSASNHVESDQTLIYSSHCQTVEQDGVTVVVSIYRGLEEGWLLEVVNENDTSIVWNDHFQSDDEAWSEFQRTIAEEGVEAFVG